MKGIEEHSEINNYLKGELQGEQLTQFEKRLETDLDFKDEVEMHRFANEAIASSAKLNIKSQLQEIHVQHQKAKKVKTIKIIAVALILIALTVTIFWVSSNNNKPNTTTGNNTDNDLVSTSIETDSSDFDLIKNDTESISQGLEPQNVNEAYYEKIITDAIVESNVSNADSIIENLGSIEHILKDPDKYRNQIKEQQKTDSLKLALETEMDTVPNDAFALTDPCLATNELNPQYQLTQPVFGGESGKIEFDRKSNEAIIFTDFSLNGGSTFVPAYTVQNVNKGNYQLIAKDENGCLSKSILIEVIYKDVNYVIQPASNKFWEIEIPEIDEFPLDLEIRNARTGALVYTQTFDYSEHFSWNGVNRNNEPLSLGNYVYIFSSKQDGLIAKGQITLL